MYNIYNNRAIKRPGLRMTGGCRYNERLNDH